MDKKKIARGRIKPKQVQKYKDMFPRKCCSICRNADKNQFRVNSTHPCHSCIFRTTVKFPV